MRDPRGVSVTLSHYCPTANDLLLSATEPVAIVDNAPEFPAAAEYVGLSADSGLPPLLHSRMAMDWESWWLFEALSVALLSQVNEPLSRLALAVEFAREWTVGSRPLPAHIHDAFTRARNATVSRSELSGARIAGRTADVLAAVSDDWQEIAADAISAPATGCVDDRVTRRFLTAHAFANWTAYQGEGLRTWFRSVETAAALLRHTADPGRADLLLRHLADSSALVARWNQAEQEPATGASG